LIFNNATDSQVYNGVISEAIASQGGVIKLGTGAVYLNAINTYTISTTNSAGLLAGSGTINSPLVEGTNGVMGGGSADAIGTLTVNGNTTLAGGVFIRLNKALAQSNDVIAVTGILTNIGTGTVTLTNLNAAKPLVVGDRFKIFSEAVSNGAAFTVADAAAQAVWANNLAVDGSVQVASIIPGYSTNISYIVSGSTLTISWPSTHLGWILQSETNTLRGGINTNWVDITGTAGATSAPFTINPTNPVIFYRLRHP
jgi:hypothetical protein